MAFIQLCRHTQNILPQRSPDVNIHYGTDMGLFAVDSISGSRFTGQNFPTIALSYSFSGPRLIKKADDLDRTQVGLAQGNAIDVSRMVGAFLRSNCTTQPRTTPARQRRRDKDAQNM